LPQSFAVIYRLADPQDWLRAQETGTFVSADLAAEGFIHFSEARQVQGAADRHCRGRGPMVLLAVEEARLEVKVVRENTSGGTDLFPHVYGPVPVAAIAWSREVPMDPDGRIRVGDL